jgi:hypothetical protein
VIRVFSTDRQADVFINIWAKSSIILYFSNITLPSSLSLALSLSLSLSLSSHLIYYWSGDLDHISIPNIRYIPAPNWLFLPINLTHFPSWSTVTAKNGRLPRSSAVARKGSSSRRWILNQLPAILHRREYITSFEQHWSMNNVMKHYCRVAALAGQRFLQQWQICLGIRFSVTTQPSWNM